MDSVTGGRRRCYSSFAEPKAAVGMGGTVLGSSVAVSSLSSEAADKDVRRSKMKKTRKAQIVNGFWMPQKSYRFSPKLKITSVI